MCAVLHNILRSQYQNHGAQQPGDGEDPDFGGVELVRGGANHGADRNPSREAKRQRDYMKQYFNNAGAVPWQDDRVGVLSGLQISPFQDYQIFQKQLIALVVYT